MRQYIHANKECTESGSRYYIHARNIASAILFLIEKGRVGELYHINGEKKVTNLEMALLIGSILEKKVKYEMINFHESRPGHDLEYCLSGEKLLSMGWKLPKNFKESLSKTVLWTVENKEWLEW